MKILIVAVCGNKKVDHPTKAWMLYKSTRIKAIHKKKRDCDFYILSAEYGLISSEKIIAPYNKVLDNKRCLELIPQVQSVCKNYDLVLFFKGGARKVYDYCIKKACQNENVKIISFGAKFMLDFFKLDLYLDKYSRR